MSAPRAISTLRLWDLLWSRRFATACVVAAIAVRLIWLSAVHPVPSSDFAWYYNQGLRIAAGEGYSITHDGFPLWALGNPLPQPIPTAFWPPGYPAFLGALFFLTRPLVEPLLAAKLANVALYVGAMLALAYVARTVFRSPLAGRVTLLLLAFLPNHIAYTSLTSVEIFFLFLTSAGVALLVRDREHSSTSVRLLAGLVFGLATLTKPQALILPAVLLAAVHWHHRRRWVTSLATTYVALALTVLPWTVRNYRVFREPVFVSNNGGVNLLIGNMPGSWTGGVMWNDELHRIVTVETDELRRDRQARLVATEYIASHPIDVLLSIPRKVATLYAVDVDGFGWNGMGDRKLGGGLLAGLRVAAQGYYMMLLALFSACLLRRPRSARSLFAVGPAVLLYFTCVYGVFFGGARFHFPMIPWMVVYGSGFLAAWLVARRGRAITLREVPIGPSESSREEGATLSSLYAEGATPLAPSLSVDSAGKRGDEIR